MIAVGVGVLLAVATSPVEVVDKAVRRARRSRWRSPPCSRSRARRPSIGTSRSSTERRQAPRRAGRSRRSRHRRAHARRRRLLRRARANGRHRDRQLGERRASGVRAPGRAISLGSSVPRHPRSPSPPPPRPRPPPAYDMLPASRWVRRTRRRRRLGRRRLVSAQRGPRTLAPRCGRPARTIAVGAHEARWRRLTASFELAHRWAPMGLVVDAHGGPTLGWTRRKASTTCRTGPIPPYHSAGPRELEQRGGFRDALRSGSISGASTSRGGTPYMDLPRERRWTKPPSRFGRDCQRRPGPGASPASPVRFS